MNETIKEKKGFNLKAVKLDKQNLLDVVKATLISVIISLIAVLIFGIVIKLTDVPVKIILPVNQVIKVISVLVGCLLGFRQKEKGAVKGTITGALYTALSVLVFWIICGSPKGNFGWADAVAGIITGAVCGIIAVNVGRRK